MAFHPGRRNHLIKVMAAGFILLGLVPGCASKVYHHRLREMVPSAPAANVYFFREDVEMGPDFALPVYLDGEKLLQLQRGTYAMVALKPGTFSIEVRPPEEDSPWRLCSDRMDFVDGQTYFLLLQYKSVGTGKCFNPGFITEERARSLMDTYRPVPQ